MSDPVTIELTGEDAYLLREVAGNMAIPPAPDFYPVRAETASKVLDALGGGGTVRNGGPDVTIQVNDDLRDAIVQMGRWMGQNNTWEMDSVERTSARLSSLDPGHGLDL